MWIFPGSNWRTSVIRGWVVFDSETKSQSRVIRVRANAGGEQFWLKRCLWQLMADAPIVDTPPPLLICSLASPLSSHQTQILSFWGGILSFGVQVVFGWLDQIYFYSAILLFIYEMFFIV